MKIFKCKKGTADNIWLAIQIFGFALFMFMVLVAWNMLTEDDELDEKL